MHFGPWVSLALPQIEGDTAGANYGFRFLPVGEEGAAHSSWSVSRAISLQAAAPLVIRAQPAALRRFSNTSQISLL